MSSCNIIPQIKTNKESVDSLLFTELYKTLPRAKALEIYDKTYSTSFLSTFGNWIKVREGWIKGTYKTVEEGAIANNIDPNKLDKYGEPLVDYVINNSDALTDNINYNLATNIPANTTVLRILEKYDGKINTNLDARDAYKLANEINVLYKREGITTKIEEIGDGSRARINLLTSGGVPYSYAIEGKLTPEIQKLIGTLRRAMPNTKVEYMTMTQAKFRFGREIDDRATSFIKGDTVVILTDRVTELTAVEEMLHPFVAAIARNNTDLFSNLLKEAKELYPGLVKEIESKYAKYKKDIPYEIVTQALTRAYHREYETNEIKSIDRIKKFAQDFWKNLVQYLDDLFGIYGGKVYTYNLSPSMKLGELAKIINTDGVELETAYNEGYNFNLGLNTQYVNQVLNFDDVTPEQKATIDKLRLLNDVTYNPSTNTYSDNTGTPFKRISDYVSELEYNDSKGYFAFEGDPDFYIESQDWGNQVDKILEGLLKGETKSEVINNWRNTLHLYTKGALTEDVVSELYDRFTIIKDEGELSGGKLFTQITAYNKAKKIAGRADVVMVLPNGKLKIFDLKTSKTSTSSFDYNRTHTRGENKRASKKQRQQAQLSGYKALFQSQGFEFEEDSLAILPVLLQEITEDFTVEATEIEPLIEISAMQPILTELNQDSEYKGETFIDNPLLIKEADTILEQIKKSLEDRLLNVEKQGETLQNYQIKKAEVERIKRLINDAETLKSIDNFISDAYNFFVTKVMPDGRVYKGLVDTIKQDISKIKTENEPLEALNELLYYKNLVEIYTPIIKNLSNFYSNFYELDLKNIADNHPLGKLRQIREAKEKVEAVYNREILPLIAKLLREMSSSSVNEASKEAYNKVLQQIKENKVQGKSTRLLESKKKKMEAKNVTDVGVDEKVLLKMLEEGSFEDISFIDMKLSPAISSSNSIIALFAKKVKEAFENARILSLHFSHDAVKAFEKYRGGKSTGDAAEFNRGLYKLTSYFYGGKEYKRYQFVSPIDYDKYNKARKSFMDSNIDVDVRRKWYRENTEAIPVEDLIIKNPETGENIIIQKGQNTLKNEKLDLVRKGIWTQYDYDSWLNSVEFKNEDGTINYYDEFQQPKMSIYRDPEYNVIQQNPAKREYYNFLVSSHFKAQSILPTTNKLDYIIPSVPKNNNDRIRDEWKNNGIVKGTLNYAKYKGKQAVSIMPEDIEYGEQQESSIKTVPVLYHNYLDPSNVSLDLLSSVMIFNDAAYKYRAQASLVGLAETTLDQLQTNAPYKTDTLGNKILDAAAAKSGAKEFYLKYKKKHGNNNVAALFEAFADMQLYNKMSVPFPVNTMFGEIEIGKLTNTLMSFTSQLQLGGFNFIGATANNLMNRVSVSIEAASRDYFTEKELAKAEFTYDKHILDYLKDFANPINKSLIGQIIDLVDPMQGEYTDKYGRKVSQSVWKKLWSMDTHFFLMHQTDHSIQVRLMIAQMQKTKVKQTLPDGSIKEISLFDAYTKDSAGKIKLKEGVVLNGRTDSTGLLDMDFQNRLHALNKRMFGVYNSLDKPELERHWYGRLLVMYKKHLVPGIKRRYKSISRDEELGTTTEGYFNTFFRLIFKEKDELLKSLANKDSKLTPMERANARKALKDIMWVASSGLIVILLQAMMEGADDDEKAALRYPLFLAMRLNADLGIYGTLGDPQNFAFPNLQESLRLFKNPTPALAPIEKFFRVVNQLSNPFEELQTNSGIWDKGDNKLAIAMLKFWGIQGTNFNPENSIKFMQTIK